MLTCFERVGKFFKLVFHFKPLEVSFSEIMCLFSACCWILPQMVVGFSKSPDYWISLWEQGRRTSPSEKLVRQFSHWLHQAGQIWPVQGNPTQILAKVMLPVRTFSEKFRTGGGAAALLPVGNPIIRTFGKSNNHLGKNPTTSWKQTQGHGETHLRRLKMKNRFFKKNFPILSKKLKLLRKVKGFRPSVTHFSKTS